MDVILPPSRYARPRVTTQALLDALWKGKWLLVSITALGVVLAALYLRVATPIYTVSIVAAPREAKTTTANALLSTALPGLVSKSEGGLIERWTVMLGSVRLAQELQARYGLMQQIFASQWDAKSQTFVAPNDLLFRIKEAVKSALGLRPWSPPTLEDLADFVGGSVKISKTSLDFFGQSQIVRISLDGTDPEFIARLLQQIFTTADLMIRTDKAAEYQRNIEYLMQQSQNARQTDLHFALTQLLAEEIKNQMLVGEGKSYVASVIEWPYVPQRPSRPNGKLVLLFGFVLGGMVAFCAALVYGLSARAGAGSSWAMTKARGGAVGKAIE